MLPTLEAVLWMLEQIIERGFLYQEEAEYHTREDFGEELVYLNDNGNLALAPRLLAEFRRETEEKVVWERYSRRWRIREEGDAPGRQQGD